MYALDLKELLLPKLLELLQSAGGVTEAVWSWVGMQLNRYLRVGWLWLWAICLAQSSLATEQIQATDLLGSHFGVPGIPATYDYVIVGGGTAGLVVARRLAANASFTVAVIEAGGFYETDNGNFSQIPGFGRSLHVSGTRRPTLLLPGCRMLNGSTYRTVRWASQESSGRLVSIH